MRHILTQTENDADTIAHRSGTYRTVGPEQTWQRVLPLLPRFGITRVADITRLDEIGLPVHIAYRPVGSTVSVSIGTGLSAAQARVSAVMESIETWHAENLRLETVARSSAGDLGLPYDVRSLNLAPRSLVTPSVVFDWVAGVGLITGRRHVVPAECILVDFTDHGAWARRLFHPSTNGLAAGNSLAEASLHGLLELVERDCTHRYLQRPKSAVNYVDPAGSGDPGTAAIHDALRRAGCEIELCDITTELGIPCYAARIWSADVPLRSGGFGCHVDPGIAMGRALAEAGQSRMAGVSGARDDIDMDIYSSVDPVNSALHTQGAGRPAHSALATSNRADDIVAVLRDCARRVADATGTEPFAVDMTHADIGIPVSKVFAPGLAMYQELALRMRRHADG